MSHCFSTTEVGMPFFYSTRVWVGWKWFDNPFRIPLCLCHSILHLIMMFPYKVDCLYYTAHFTKQNISISNILILIRMLIILFWVAKEMFWCLLFLSFRNLLGDIMTSKRDLRSYFVKIDNTNKETLSSSQKVSLVIQSSSNITGETEIQYV